MLLLFQIQIRCPQKLTDIVFFDFFSLFCSLSKNTQENNFFIFYRCCVFFWWLQRFSVFCYQKPFFIHIFRRQQLMCWIIRYTVSEILLLHSIQLKQQKSEYDKTLQSGKLQGNGTFLQ